MNKYEKMLKVLLFKKCRMITDKQMRKFAVLALKSAPDYFWTEPASTSGKHHAGESLTEHVLYCLQYAKEHIRMLVEGVKRKWSDKHSNILYTALICHDLFRSGMPGRESRYDDGRLRTDDLHTVYAPRVLKYINMYVGPEDKRWYAKNNLPWNQLEDAMAGHYGSWSPLVHLDPTIDRDFLSSVALHVFLIDYVVSRSCIRIVHPEIEELRRNDDLYQVGEIESYGIPKGYPENTRDWNRQMKSKGLQEDFEERYGPA